jgi:membrane-associated phospholipid phosphatase
LLNCTSIVHGAIIHTDIQVAYALNSLVGAHSGIDKVIGFVNTKFGDLVVIFCLGLVFLAHSLKASSLREKVSRLTFWGWTGAIVLSAYVGIWSIEDYIARPIPLQVLRNLHNGQTMNGLHLHSSANESFPSGHALAFILFVFMSFRRYPKMSILLGLIGAVLLPIRLALGLHWLSDMALGSLALASFLAAFAQETALMKAYYLARRIVFLALKITHIRRRRAIFLPSGSDQGSCIPDVGTSSRLRMSR